MAAACESRQSGTQSWRMVDGLSSFGFDYDDGYSYIHFILALIRETVGMEESILLHCIIISNLLYNVNSGNKPLVNIIYI